MDASTINVEVDPAIVREALLDALNERGWVAHMINGVWLVRSPDRLLTIFFDRCTADEVIDTVNRWRTAATTARHVH